MCLEQLVGSLLLSWSIEVFFSLSYWRIFFNPALQIIGHIPDSLNAPIKVYSFITFYRIRVKFAKEWSDWIFRIKVLTCVLDCLVLIMLPSLEHATSRGYKACVRWDGYSKRAIWFSDALLTNSGYSWADIAITLEHFPWFGRPSTNVLNKVIQILHYNVIICIPCWLNW